MTKILTKIVLAAALFVTANAGDKFSNLTEEYLNGQTTVDVRKVIAQDPQTSTKILKILAEDSNSDVRAIAKQNLK